MSLSKCICLVDHNIYSILDPLLSFTTQSSADRWVASPICRECTCWSLTLTEASGLFFLNCIFERFLLQFETHGHFIEIASTCFDFLRSFWSSFDLHLLDSVAYCQCIQMKWDLTAKLFSYLHWIVNPTFSDSGYAVSHVLREEFEYIQTTVSFI